MRILELLDELIEEIENSPKAVFSSKRSIDYEIVMEIINDLKNALPQELLDAEEIMKEKEQILASAHEEGASIVKSAEDELQTRVSDNSVVQEAEAQSKEIVSKAEETAKQITMGAKEYADDILAEVETYFTDYLKVLRKNRQELSSKRKS
jgi:vacuolar-type H+-ATPase subunit H